MADLSSAAFGWRPMVGWAARMLMVYLAAAIVGALVFLAVAAVVARREPVKPQAQMPKAQVQIRPAALPIDQVREYDDQPTPLSVSPAPAESSVPVAGDTEPRTTQPKNAPPMIAVQPPSGAHLGTAQVRRHPALKDEHQLRATQTPLPTYKQAYPYAAANPGMSSTGGAVTGGATYAPWPTTSVDKGTYTPPPAYWSESTWGASR